MVNELIGLVRKRKKKVMNYFIGSLPYRVFLMLSCVNGSTEAGINNCQSCPGENETSSAMH